MKFISTLAAAAAVATLVVPSFAQTSPMQHDTMHKPMAHGKMTPQQMKAMHSKMMKHDAMMKHDTMMKHDAMMHHAAPK